MSLRTNQTRHTLAEVEALAAQDPARWSSVLANMRSDGTAELVVTHTGQPLDVCMGAVAGLSLHLRALGPLTDVRPLGGQRFAAKVPAGWNLVAVCTKGVSRQARLFILAPAEAMNEVWVRKDELYVRGRFEVVAKVNNSRLAAETFKTFEPE